MRAFMQMCNLCDRTIRMHVCEHMRIHTMRVHVGEGTFSVCVSKFETHIQFVGCLQIRIVLRMGLSSNSKSYSQ